MGLPLPGKEEKSAAQTDRFTSRLMETQVKRLLGAVFAVMLIVALPPLSKGVLAEASAEQRVQDDGALISSSSLIDAFDAEGSLSRIDALVSQPQVDIPKKVQDEVGFPDECRDVRVGAAESVVSYVVDEDAQWAKSDLDDRMRRSGWTSVDAAGVSAGTYVKEEGECRWVLATFTQSGSSTNVVMRVA